METRVARIDDLPQILEIYNQAVAMEATADVEPMDSARAEAWFAAHRSPERPIIVAHRGDLVLGWLSLSDHRPGRKAVRHTAEVSYYVHRDHQRQGVATKLLRECLDTCAARSIKTLFAILLEDNLASVVILEKFGFEKWGFLPRVADFDGREVGQLYYGRRVTAKRP